MMKAMETTSSLQSNWRAALRWGFGVALAQRVFLTLWLAAVWLSIGEPSSLAGAIEAATDDRAQLPVMTTPLERAFLGVWRRWDGTHYLNLAQNSYRPEDPGPTVFGPLTPLGIRLSDGLVPGPLELGGIVFITLMFGLALTFLYQFVVVYFRDRRLAERSVLLMAILPLAYFFAAPMSEALYMAMVLGFFCFGAGRRWWLAALCGALATLARAQGVLLVGVAGLMLLEQNWPLVPDWRGRLRSIIAQAAPLLLLPLAYTGFLLYRSSLGLPSLETVFYEQSYVALVDPVTGFISNLRQIALNPLAALQNVDYVALLVAIPLCGLLIRKARFRRWSLIAFCIGYLMVFVSKVNYPWGSHTELLGTQSLARYSLTLFPLTILLADLIWRLPKYGRLLALAASVAGLVIYSAQFALGGGPA
jgi:hypothetical protein